MTAGTPAAPIGIITALPVECHAVRSLLVDEQPVPADPDDPVVYYRGRLGAREVVLALLTEAGGVAAVSACVNLQRTWHVRYVVMCGIACGVPDPGRPERHVRLGDILVATEGVVAYDSLRVLRDGEHLRRGPVRPSVALRSAALRLRVEEESGLRPWERGLAAPERGYGRPPADTDVITDDDGEVIDHPPTGVSGHRPGWPKVHFGLIGSGGRLIRSSVERNRLARLHGIVGLEMEGFAVSDGSYLQGIEWFMVRGVSDYGNSAKNDHWHRYASLAAASYVRVLLNRLALPAAGRPAAAVVDSVFDDDSRLRPSPLKRPPERDPSARNLIVQALLECRTMRDAAGRDAVIDSLPRAVRSVVPRNSQAVLAVTGLVETLWEAPELFAAVHEAIRLVEGASGPVEALGRVLRRLVLEEDPPQE